MAISGLGYPKNLFVLPFDHRSSFEKGLFGIEDRAPLADEVEQISDYKRMIYEGLLKAIGNGVLKEYTAILVDQVYGSALLADAKEKGIMTCSPVEKSGQNEFDFEFGDDFNSFLELAEPTFAKVLVRYNPEDRGEVNKIQRRKLKVLSDYCHEKGFKFMFELLVPPTKEQLELVMQDSSTYDLKLRPKLARLAMAQLQHAGIEPDVWKIEGTEDPQAAENFVAQARVGYRDDVGIIILGRGENEEKVREWLKVGARTKGIIGFAVGRTVFWQPLVDYKDGKISREDAVSRISSTYQELYKLFIDARSKVNFYD